MKYYIYLEDYAICMSENTSLKGAIKKLFNLINLEKSEIKNVYIYAVLNGAIILSLPLGIQAIINLMFGVNLSTSLVVMIALVIFGVLLNGIFQIKQMRVIEKLQQRIFTRLTFAYAYRIPKINLISIDKYYLPELVNRFFDTATLQKGLSKLLLDLPTATIQVLFGIVLLGFYHPIFVVFGITLLLVGIVIFYSSSSKGFTSSIEESDYKYKVAFWLEELARSIKTFKYHQQTDLHLKRTDDLVGGYLNSRNNHFSVLLLQYRVIIGFKVIVTAAMLVVGAFLFINQVINLGQFIATEIIIITIINAMEKLIISLEVVYDVLTALEKIDKVLEKPLDNDSDELITLENWLPVDGLKVTATNLNFGFEDENLILKDINLSINAGEKVCIYGAQDSGKSTLIKLLTGLWQNYNGGLMINNIPVRNISPSVLHHEISFYLTDDELFTGTLIENITLGEKDIDFNELQKVIELVGLSDFVSRKRKGFETVLDSQGKKLSYNIVQKILLARCLYKKPSLLLLEDGWMYIDEESKNKIIAYLTSKSTNFTMIAVSNDPAFMAKCDKTFIMDGGKINGYDHVSTG
ncbi:ABC transporter ATP-binding protein [Pedobacter changchengzhani]|uniref:ABC transporter ATP-binding protein n=1 Tax=Pedobacter changchengzhani TaxID=2529274 RepID=A0A4R5MPL6_9SPHI|nr:ABC transporter ATP-binding protein [Pedobacter changchengzhani]TDG37762.1 ABC transporter ATP-binding protein [Pedobacter changchengzhani]